MCEFDKFSQPVKKNRDPRWEEEFQFMLEEPPTNERIHVEVVSISSRIGLLHPKVSLFSFPEYVVTSDNTKFINPIINS